MIKSAVTISLVPEARGGPFVFWDDLEAACRTAAELGFDGLEVFPRGAAAFDADMLRQLLGRYGLKLAAMGTGAGWVLHRFSLTAADPSERLKAVAFVRSLIDLAGSFGAPAIVGSMQGRWDERRHRYDADAALVPALDELAEHAQQYNVPLLFEPLNRYETNIANTLEDGVSLLGRVRSGNMKLLADLFHMNIEESDIAAALRSAGRHIGHVHFADSNRRPVGMGHTQMAPVVAALRDIGYEGFVSAEALSFPSPYAAARKTIESFRELFRSRDA